jgi:hypothetical protein
VFSGRKRSPGPRGSNGVHPRAHSARVKASRDGPTLFDFLSAGPEDSEPPAAPETAPSAVPLTPASAEIEHPPDRSASSLKHCSGTPPFAIASGEKAKARDILAAIRAVKTIESELRLATPEERHVLARFAGFGPVALSVFPDPVTGSYKDASWQALGEELKALLTFEEYESAKRTTFNAFYTSATVITAIHEAIARLGIPKSAKVLEPGCGTGNFMSMAPAEMRFIGVELDQISGQIAKLLHPDQDIRIENFRETRLPENGIDAVVGNVPFADLKLDYRGQKLSLHDYFFAKSIDALRPGGVLALVTTHFTLDKLCGRPHNLSCVA